jgi:hypothetical protein
MASMATHTSGIVHQAQLAEAVERARAKLDPSEVRLVRYNIGTDSTGEITIFFRVLLSDYASQEERLGDIATRIEAIIFDEIKSFDNWGILPDFSFRSESEQRDHYDASWV